jgi:hypothetical protein
MPCEFRGEPREAPSVSSGSVPRVRFPRGGVRSSARTECHTAWAGIETVEIQIDGLFGGDCQPATEEGY